MKKREEYNLLKVLQQHGAINEDKGLIIGNNEKEFNYKNLSYSIEEIDFLANKLIDKEYIDASYYTNSIVKKLVITNKGIKFVTNYLNKNLIGKSIYFLKEYSTIISLIISVLAMIISFTK